MKIFLKILFIFCLLFLTNKIMAANPVRYVQISTNSLSQQSGAYNVSSGTATNFNSSTCSISNITNLSTITFINGSTITTNGSGIQITSATITDSININNRKLLNVSSGTIASDGTRFSQNKILQIIMYTIQTTSATTSTSFIKTTLTGSITPMSTSSKILIMGSFPWTNDNAGGASFITIFRDNTNVGGSNGTGRMSGSSMQMASVNYLDSPATTSPVSYTIGLAADGAGHTATLGNVTTITSISTLILIEVNGL